MPPRTRSNRVEKLAYQHMVTLGKPVNAFGLPSLPDELFLLIISFFQTCQIPEETRDLPGNGVAPRHKILLVLTMTCRALRRVCLPFLWQRVEARAGMEGVDDVISGHGGQHWMKTGHLFLYDKALSREVLRQLETVTIREPKYAVYVNVVNLDIMQSTDTLLQELLNSLELFPRLHTVRLRTGGRLFGKELQRIQALLSSWQPKAPLASVKKWYSNQLVSRLMRFCPNVHSAGGLLFDTLELGQLQMTLVHTMEAIERLENVTTAFFVKMPDLAAKFPNLRHISLKMREYRGSPNPEFPPFGQTLAAFQSLDSIDFQFIGRSWPRDESWRDDVAAGPIAVLRGIQGRDKRVKRFRLRESTSGLTRRVYDIVLPLHGVPAWIESVAEVAP